MSTLRAHLATSLLALMLAFLVASPPAGGNFGVRSHEPLPADGILIPACDANVDDGASSSDDGPPDSGPVALLVQGPQLSLDASGRIDLARSYQGISPARHLRRGGHSPPRCPP